MSEHPSTQVRHFVFDVAARASDDAIPVVVSSDAVVEVSDGPEILVHTPDAIDLRRAPLPIIATHRGGQVNVGIVDGLQIEGGRLRGMARFGARQEASEYRTDVLNQIIRSVSVGYARIKAKVRDDGVLVTSRWMPTHTALVAEPADINAGFFRSLDAVPAFELEVSADALEQPSAQPTAHKAESRALAENPPLPTAAQPQVTQPAAPAVITRSLQMAENQTAAGQAVAETKIVVTEDNSQRQSAMEIENQRREAIVNLCRANKIDQRTEADWIQHGSSLNEVARGILEVQTNRQAAEKTYASAAGLSSRETQRYSLFKVMRAIKHGAVNPKFYAEAAFEIECSREVGKKMNLIESGSFYVPVEVLQRPATDTDVHARTMATTPGAKGGYSVDVTNMGFIDILRNRSVASAMGATYLPGLVGQVAFVRQTASPSVTWQAGEATSVTAADQTLGQLSMTPKTAIVITDVTEQLLRQSSPSAEAFVLGDLAKTLATAVDLATITGTGGAQPLGIKNTTGITSGQDAASVTWDKIRAFWTAAAGANAVLARPGWLTTSAGAALLSGKQRFSSTDTPIWEGNPNDGTIWGMRAMSSEQMPSGNLIFGSWEHLLVGEWGVLELSQDSGGTRFNNATVGIRAMWMVDTLLRYPQAFVSSVNLS